MTEYIEREAAVTVLMLPKEHREYQTFNLDDAYEQGWYDALDNLVNIPAADAAPVRHEKWEVIVGSDGKEHMVCTGCRKQQDLTGVFTYCPNCGAIMDLED